MNKYLPFPVSAVMLFLFLACQPNKPEPKEAKIIDPLQAALPHGDTLPDSEMSEDDRLKLEKAIGRTADTIQINKLIQQIDSSSNLLHAYVFWKLECQTCISQYKMVHKLQQEVGETNLKVILVNLDHATELPKVNTQIRLQGVSSEVFAVTDFEISALPPKYRNLFSSKLPTILFANKSHGTFIFYDRIFEYPELFATTQPLLM